MKYLKKLNRWYDVPGYCGLYLITNRNGGMVKSCDHPVMGNGGVKIKRGRILKQFVRGKYKSVGLSKRNFVTCYDVHVLLANVFIPNPENKPTVNHDNCDKMDNRLRNLSWATHSEQIKHALKNGLFTMPNPMKGKLGYDHNKSKPVVQYTMGGDFVNHFGSANEAQRETGYQQTGISKCCRGDQSQHKGFIWQYQ